MTPKPTILYPTVSAQFVEDWLVALRALCADAHYASLLRRSGLRPSGGQQHGRVTLDQIVTLYQLAAVETGDEMMGLWSRAIRPRALQHLLTSVREARSLPAALYRFSTFWNLLLDDYQFQLDDRDGAIVLSLVPQTGAAPQRFGHMLILKLAHGLLSWMARREVPIAVVDFAFGRPSFDEDYVHIFPAPVRFEAVASALHFDGESLGSVQVRSTKDLDLFLETAPRDWIFTRSQEHTQSLRVRAFLSQTTWDKAQLDKAATALHLTPRTLMRKLEADGTSFQSIKDALRRDIAIRRLQTESSSVDAIAHDVGFASTASFYKAFQRWTGSTPSAYRGKETQSD
ncbi:MAG: AraC family transcriptional regulator ligand-binding domain-containing protein [Pseudomonadota bacterium]